MLEMGWQDKHMSYLALRATLHALRDRLTVEEAAQLAAELPMLVRGFYYEGWDPAGKPVKERHVEQFLSHIEQAFNRDGDMDARRIARAVFALLERRISEGEIEDIRHLLPSDVRELARAV